VCECSGDRECRLIDAQRLNKSCHDTWKIEVDIMKEVKKRLKSSEPTITIRTADGEEYAYDETAPLPLGERRFTVSCSKCSFSGEIVYVIATECSCSQVWLDENSEDDHRHSEEAQPYFICYKCELYYCMDCLNSCEICGKGPFCSSCIEQCDICDKLICSENSGENSGCSVYCEIPSLFNRPVNGVLCHEHGDMIRIGADERLRKRKRNKEKHPSTISISQFSW
jgi:hypothetical protein